MITILDAGISNVGSLQNMLKKIGQKVEIAHDEDTLARAEKLILPGVGAFDTAMTRLGAGGYVEVLQELALQRRIPILGICLGMHLMCRTSEEGVKSGLGFFAADVKKIKPGSGYKVPHMGWNATSPVSDHPLMRGDADMRFYYVHSYNPVCDDEGDCIARAQYGVPLVAAMARGNLMAVQFHPEKSHRFGMQLLSNFAGCV